MPADSPAWLPPPLDAGTLPPPPDLSPPPALDTPSESVPVHRQNTPDAGFFHGLASEAGDYATALKYAVTHPYDAVAAAAQGVGAAGRYLAHAVSDPTRVKQDLSGMAHEIATHPREALGRLTADIVAGLLTGGVAGKLASKALTKGLAANIPKGGRAVATTGGAMAAGASGAGGAGVIAASQGRPVEGSEAALGALLGSTPVTAPAVGRAAKTLAREAGKTVNHHFPHVAAAFHDPVEYFESKALHAPSEPERRVAKRAHELLTKLSLAGDRARRQTEEAIRPLRRARDELPEDDLPALETALRETDARWGMDKPLVLKPDELRDMGLSDKAIRAYYTTLDVYERLGQEYRKAWIAAHPKDVEHAPVIKRGILPRRWDARHRVFYRDEDGNAVVRAFTSPAKAAEFARKHGGVNLDEFDRRFDSMDLDSLIQMAANRLGKKAKPEAILAEMRKIKTPGADLGGLFARRRGVGGYTSLRSYNDLLDAIERTAYAVHTARANMRLSPFYRQVLEEVRRTFPSPMEANLLESAYERHIGRRRPHAIARAVKGALLHSMLGTITNQIVGLLNLGTGVLTLTPYIMWESRKAARGLYRRLGEENPAPIEEQSLADAIAITARVLPAVLPKKVRDALWDANRSRIAQHLHENEITGIVPSAESVQLADSAGVGQRHVFKAGTHETRSRLRAGVNRGIARAERVNTWLLRHSEVAARRMTAAAMREVGIQMGLTGTELDRFVHAATESAVGRFNRGMRAAVLEGGEGALADVMAVGLTFQTWIAQKSIQIARMLREHPAAGATMLGTFIGLAGAEGVPLIVPMMNAAIDAVDPSGELRAQWEQYKLDHPQLFHGALSQLPVDLSGRFGIGLPLNVASEYDTNVLGMYETFLHSLKAANDAYRAAAYAEGVPAGVAAGAAQFGKTFVSGDLARHIGGVRALLNGGDYAPVARGRYETHEPISREEALAAALTGGVPRSVSRKQHLVRAQKALTQLDTERMASIREMYVQTGDAEKAARLVHIARPELSAKQVRRVLREWQRVRERRHQMYRPQVRKHSRASMLTLPEGGQ